MHAQLAVLVAAAGAGWETAALRQLDAPPGVTMLKRCVDLADLLASASTGQADVAVVAAELTGFDADSVAHLQRYGTAVVAVVAQPGDAAEQRFRRMGVRDVLPAAGVAGLRATLARAGSDPPGEQPPARATAAGSESPLSPACRTVAVWGPAGAPGRTTVAVGIAAELAARGTSTFLVDADAYSGAVAQHLGILDEVSGLLGAARMANAGRIDEQALASFGRQVSPGLTVLTGLPRADRWSEVRSGAFEQVLDLATRLAEVVVVDVGFSLEQDRNAAFGSTAPQRNALTLTALETADEVVVVGSADPVGLGRLARGLVDLVEAVPGGSLRVVVNRMRGALGWREDDIRRTLAEFTTGAAVHFLPDDRAACDRSLVAGMSLVEAGDSSLRRSLAGLVDAMSSAGSPVAGRGRLRRTRGPVRGSTRRTGGRAR